MASNTRLINLHLLGNNDGIDVEKCRPNTVNNWNVIVQVDKTRGSSCHRGDVIAKHPYLCETKFGINTGRNVHLRRANILLEIMLEIVNVTRG